MNQKYWVILFIPLAIVGLATVGFNSLQNATNTSTPANVTSQPQISNFDQTVSGQPVPSVNEPASTVSKQYTQFPGILSLKELQNKKAVIETSKGKIEFEIYPEASRAASNFIFLAKDGFYNNLTFHRVEPGFVIQGGDPGGNGTGGPGYRFEDEPVTRKYDRGIVAMANAGPNTNGSQFFIMLADRSDLPPKYTIFGKIISGLEIVDKIQVGDIMKRVSIANFVQTNLTSTP